MGFEVPASAYDRFIGQFSAQLAGPMADLGRVRTGGRALDVGCGPGALTSELVARLGPADVAAVDPSDSFVAAARERHPEVRVVQAAAEDLPFADAVFDAVLAQLVVHFMADPVAGLREMARVAVAGGAVAACVWDHAGGRSPLSPFWAAVHRVDPDAEDESRLAGARAGHLVELFGAAGLADVRGAELTARVGYERFEEWWEPYTLGIGPAGAYVAGLDQDRRGALREACREGLPKPPFELEAVAWAAVGAPEP